MKIHFIITVLLAVAYGEAFTKSFDPANFETQELKYVGLADGVAYFYNMSSPTMSWYEAVEYCKAANLQLAVINTGNQMQLLRSATEAQLTNSLYWTSGRDAHNIRQFSWDSTNTAVPEFVANDGISNWVGVGNFQTCLTIYKQGKRVSVGIFACNAGHHTLCSTL